MEQLNAIDVLTPLMGGCSFYAEERSIRHFCLRVEKGIMAGQRVIFLAQDFFGGGFSVIEDDWSATIKGNDILCESPYGQKILVSPVDRGTVIPQTVDWKPELKLLNFVNKELWEEELIREISGITYYPIDLFRFKDKRTVLRSPQIKWLYKDLHIQCKRYTKTLYYYIKDNRLYIGLWNYELRMPDNPIRLCEIDENIYKAMEG